MQRREDRVAVITGETHQVQEAPATKPVDGRCSFARKNRWFKGKCITGWWFQTFFIFHNIWDNPSHKVFDSH